MTTVHCADAQVNPEFVVVYNAFHLYLFQLGKGYNESSISDLIARDKAGEFPRILHNPMYKDTIAVHGKGGYSVVRFKAVNPGKIPELTR